MMLRQWQALAIAPELARGIRAGVAQDGAAAVLEEILFLARKYDWTDVLETAADVLRDGNGALAGPVPAVPVRR